jgi:two-component system, NtrC family, sensor kinase
MTETAGTVDQLMREREATGIRYMSTARIVFSIVGLLFTVSPWGGDYDLGQLQILWLFSVSVNTGILLYLRRGKRLAIVGFTGVFLDLGFLACLPYIWYGWVGESQVSAAFLVKFPATVWCFLTISITSLAMHPRYPIVATAGSFVIHLVLLNSAYGDSRSFTSVNFAEVFLGEAYSMDLYLAQITVLLLSGGTLAFLTRIARQTVYRAVVLETEYAEMRAMQARMIMQGKMDGLKNLVAGFAHEVNSPIGAVKSGADLTERCATKITNVLDTSTSLEEAKSSPPMQKSISTLRTSSTATMTASDRISAVVRSLRNFARLDEAEHQVADLHEGIESTLTLLEHHLKDRIVVKKSYGTLKPVLCSPAEINQVFMNVITNAIQAIEGSGTVDITTEMDGENAIVSVSDTGKGMTSQQMETLFEPGFVKTDTRMKAGLGMFTSLNIVHNHHGEILVESTPDAGTTVTIRLPVDRQ